MKGGYPLDWKAEAGDRQPGEQLGHLQQPGAEGGVPDKGGSFLLVEHKEM